MEPDRKAGAAIRGARESINVELFIFNDGKLATEFAQRLADVLVALA